MREKTTINTTNNGSLFQQTDLVRVRLAENVAIDLTKHDRDGLTPLTKYEYSTVTKYEYSIVSRL